MEITKIYIISLFFAFICMSQNINSQSKYGNTTVDELNMASYPQDTTAAAVILSKVGDSKFVYNDNKGGFKFEYTVQTKIKILKTEGLDWCNQEISYYQQNSSSKEEVSGVSGTTYNLENGKIVKTKLSKEFIFEEATDNKWKVKKITMPSAKVGSVIEYKYTIVSDFFWDLREFNFQSSIPTLYTLFEIVIPEYFSFNVDQQGYITLKTKKDQTNEAIPYSYRGNDGKLYYDNIRYNGDRYRFEGQDIPAIKNEGYLWTIRDYISKVSFELRSIQLPHSMVKNYTSSWGAIDKQLFESDWLGNNLKKADLFKNEISKTEIDLNRAKEIQDMIKYKVKWDDKNSAYPKNLKDALKNGIGNSADINFLLINALKAAGFNAFPVLLSTREKGRMPITHPSIDAFNYAITGIKIDTTTYFTDASAKYGDWNLLPEKCMVPKARMLDPEFCDWTDLSTISYGTVLKTAKFSFANSKYEGKVIDTRRGNSAYNTKLNYEKYKDENEYIESLSKRLGCNVDSFSISNLDNTRENLKMEFIQSTDMPLGDEYLYINPLIDKLYSDNPFKKEERVFPIEFDYLLNYVQVVDIDIPEGYVVEELPKVEKFVYGYNDIVLLYRLAQENNVIKLHYQYQLKKLQFLYDEYKGLQDFYSKLILKNSEQIVLKKVSSNE